MMRHNIRSFALAGAAVAALAGTTGCGKTPESETASRPAGVTYPASSEVSPFAKAPPQAAPGQGSRAQRVAELARFEPPEYREPSHSSENGAAFLFSTAMEHYRNGNYEESAKGLQLLLSSRPDITDAIFYLGICNLATSQFAAGITWLQRAAETNDPVFEGEARFYMSKALLQKGDVPSARTELQRVAELKGERAREAAAMLDAIDKLPPA